MGERTSYPNGTPSWADLATSDPEGAKAFYSGLFGWHAEDMPAGGGMTYTMCSLDGKWVAALYAAGPEQGPPHWNTYISVDDVDATAAAVPGAGGTVAMEPFDVLDSGRMAFVADPTGAFVGLWEARNHIGAQLVNAHGAMSWNELGTTDPEAAAAFFRELLGYETPQAQGGDGGYLMIKSGDAWVGGIRRQDPQTEAGVPPNWLVYFGCDDLETTLARATELGGRVLVPRVDMDGRGSFAVLQDPQEAVFALYAGAFDP